MEVQLILCSMGLATPNRKSVIVLEICVLLADQQLTFFPAPVWFIRMIYSRAAKFTNIPLWALPFDALHCMQTSVFSFCSKNFDDAKKANQHNRNSSVSKSNYYVIKEKKIKKKNKKYGWKWWERGEGSIKYDNLFEITCFFWNYTQLFGFYLFYLTIVAHDRFLCTS